MPSLNSLMSGGYEPDYAEAYDNAIIPEIDNQYVVEYQDNGNIYKEVFTVWDCDNPKRVFAKALSFANNHDTLLFYQELYTEYYNPKTGEPVETPLDASYCKHFYDQPIQPYQTRQDGFEAIDSDELPF